MTSDALLDLLSVDELPVARQAADAGQSSALGFTLLLVVNALLFLRPTDILPDFADLPLFEIAILACLIVSLPIVIQELSWQSLKQRPVTLFVVALLPMIVLSNLAYGRTWEARMGGADFGKIVIYYLLVVGLVNSQHRLKYFIYSIVFFLIVDSGIALLNHYQVIDLPALAEIVMNSPIADGSGNTQVVSRLIGPGIFHDPNDFGMILAIGIVLCLKFLFDAASWSRRAAWLLTITLFSFVVSLTHSRGAFLALLAGVICFIIARLGWRKSIPLALLVLPVMLYLFAGRETNIDLDNKADTAQGRILIWRDCLVLFHQHPIAGVGYGRLGEEVDHVAHNSFVHAYAELGIIGGTLFLAAFYVPALALWRFRPSPAPDADADEINRWRICLFGVFAAYIVGMLSLSRNYVMPTYFVLALGSVWLYLAKDRHPAAAPRFNQSLIRQVGFASVLFLLFIHVFVKTFAI